MVEKRYPGFDSPSGPPMTAAEVERIVREDDERDTANEEST